MTPVMRALVTGAAGFIGSHLVERLLHLEMEVVGVDNLSTGSMANLAQAQTYETFQLVDADISDVSTLRRACQQIQYLFHLAAATKIGESVRDPEKYQTINVAGTRNVLQAARKAKVARVVFASSAAVYGTPEVIPIPEDATLRPLSPYGASKVEGERLCQAAAAKHGVVVPQLRFFNVYGPRQLMDAEAGVVRIFLHRAKQGQPLIIYGDGHQTRDFLYVDDAVEALLRAAMGDTVPSVPINVGTGIPISILELAETVQAQVPSCTSELQFEPPREGDIYHSVAQVDRLHQVLHFRPQIALREGLVKTHHFHPDARE